MTVMDRKTFSFKKATKQNSSGSRIYREKIPDHALPSTKGSEHVFECVQSPGMEYRLSQM